MSVLALYVPHPDQLLSDILLIFVALLVLTALSHWLRLPSLKTAVLMLAGAVIVSLPAVVTRWNVDLGWIGDCAREMSSTNYSDTFFAITSYFHVGMGCPIALGGMVGGLILRGVSHGIRQKRHTGDEFFEAARPGV